MIKGKLIPPSVTVRFCTVNKKDALLKSYKNYDHANSKPRDVKVFQSLAPHYADLRRTILNFLKCDLTDSISKHGLSNCGIGIKWCTYQSSTSGFAVKLGNGDYFNKIHLWIDFVNQFRAKFPNSVTDT